MTLFDNNNNMLNEGVLTDFLGWARDKIKGASIKIFKIIGGKKGLLSFRKGKTTHVLGLNVKTKQLGVGLKNSKK